MGDGLKMGIRMRVGEGKSKKQPGPGDYDPKKEVVLESKPSVGFGSASRTTGKGSGKIPGPGAYNGEAVLKEAPKFG